MSTSEADLLLMEESQETETHGPSRSAPVAPPILPPPPPTPAPPRRGRRTRKRKSLPPQGKTINVSFI